MRFLIRPTAIWGVAREVKTATEEVTPLIVAGAPETAGRLVEALGRGAHPGAVRDLSRSELSRYDLEGAKVLAYAIEGATRTEADERTLRLADRQDVEVVCVLVREEPETIVDVPFVLATDVISVAPGEELPVERIAERIAAQIGDDGYLLASRAPVLRRPICEQIVRRFARQNGFLAAAIFIPGADFPVLTLNQIRMVLRIAAAHGQEIDARRGVELLSVLGAGLGLREVARSAVGVVPGLGWAVQGGVALVGTRALGEAAVAYFESGLPDRIENVVRSRS